MYSYKDEHKIISSIKGRLSKVLTFKSQLLVSEKNTLEDLYNAIDKFIVSEKKDDNIKTFNDTIQRDTRLLENTDKKYIKKHILPLINKLTTCKWEGRDE